MSEDFVDIQVDVDDKLYKEIKKAADLLGMTVNEFASQAVTEHVERLMQEEGLDEV